MLPQNLLNKVEDFVKLASAEIKDLKSDRMEKQAQLDNTIEKIADQLYEQDFFSDLSSRRSFVKAAAENPEKIAEVLTQVIHSKDVMSFGTITDDFTKAASDEGKWANDPIARRAGLI